MVEEDIERLEVIDLDSEKEARSVPLWMDTARLVRRCRVRLSWSADLKSKGFVRSIMCNLASCCCNM